MLFGSIIRESRRHGAFCDLLCFRTSGGEGCGKRWPDRCKRIKGEMRWYVPYVLPHLGCTGLIPGEAVVCSTPQDCWVNRFSSDIVEKEGYRNIEALQL